MTRSGCLLVAACACVPFANANEPVHARFDAGFLRGGRVDLARFAWGMPVEPGVHVLEMRRNGRALGRHPVRFETRPCIDATLARVLELEVARLAREHRLALADPSACVALDTLVAGATLVHDPGEMALDATIPRAALRLRADDAIDPDLYDAGISALRFAYGVTVAHRDGRVDDTTGTARTELGTNLGGWRWRHRATHAWRSGEPVRSRSIASALERDVVSIQAQLTLGDFHTRGVLFDAVRLRGARMQSDERMWPPSHTRPAPVVRGIAATHARVQVRQGDALLLDTTVPPGPFALDDIRPLGLGRPLDVRVIEADGRVAAFAVPYAAMPGALRRGQARFSVSAGQWRDAGGSDAIVTESSWEAGIGDRVTMRAGSQLATGYAHVLGGFAWSMRAGAMSLDASGARLAADARADAGASLRVAYAGNLPSTRTTFDVAAWRHGSPDFRTLHDALRPARADAPRERTRIDVALRQDLRRAGSLSLSHVERRTASGPEKRRSTQLGYGVTLGNGSATLQATLERTRQPLRRHEASLSFAMPLRIGGARHSFQSNVRTASDELGVQAGIQGNAGRDDRIAWSLGALHASPRGRDAATTSSGSLAWRGNAARIGTALSASPTARNASATIDGAVLLHRRGATFAPVFGDTLALLHAPDAAGARLVQDPARRIDRRGYAVVASLSPYRRNRVGIDPRGAPASTHFEFTERDVVPRAGAVVELVLPTSHAPARWLRLARGDGAPPPFAAQVVDPRGMELGRVGRDGIAWIRAAMGTQQLDVRWSSEGEAFSCRVALGDTGDADTLRDATCEESTR